MESEAPAGKRYLAYFWKLSDSMACGKGRAKDGERRIFIMELEIASKINLDSIVRKIMENEIGILLLKTDGGCVFDIIASESCYKDRLGMCGSEGDITYHLYPILYGKKDTAETRMNAIQNLFLRWDTLGYNKRHAKSAFKSKEFGKYLDQIGFYQADYMLLMVD